MDIRVMSEEDRLAKNAKISIANKGVQKSNPFNWSLRSIDSNNGSLLYKPYELMDKFEDYVDWVIRTPLYESILHQKTGELLEIPKMRAMTIQGFSLYCGMTSQTFLFYEKKLEYKNICSAIRDAMYSQKFEGAAAGLLNSNLISRDLGLKDTVDMSVVDNRKTISDLFPVVEDIDAVVINETKELPYGDTRIDTN